MKISVIVPVYNAVDTITECLGNLLNQSYSDMEIILVDDASTDGTPQILQSAKNQFPDKVRVFRQQVNQGPGAARNVGLSVATGDYVGFVDADDVIDVRMYEKLAALVEDTGADIADCAFYRESHDLALLHFDKSLMGTLDAKKKSDLIASGGFTVTKLFRRSMLLDIELLFRPAYGLEDMDFLIRAIIEAKSAASTDEVLYSYRDANAASLSKEMDFFKYYQNHLGAMIGIYEKTHDLDAYAGIQAACEYGMLALYSNILKLAYQKKDEMDRQLLTELLTGLRTARLQCITIPVAQNPYKKLLDKDAIEVIERTDKSVEELFK